LEKNEFRVLVYIPIFCFIVLLLGIGSFWFALTHSNGQETVIVIIVFALSIVISPLALFVWSFMTMWPCVKFSTEGIEKTLLGKKQKFILWDEVYEIRRMKTGITEWVFFSKTSLENKAIDKCRKRKDNIFIVSTIDVEKAIKHFAPSRLLQK